MLATSVAVQTRAAWPDFVFDSAYRLAPLKKVAAYIYANKRLPDMPTAADIASGGLDLGAMQARQMQKIEELTLYVIQMQARLEALQAKVDSLEQRR